MNKVEIHFWKITKVGNFHGARERKAYISNQQLKTISSLQTGACFFWGGERFIHVISLWKLLYYCYKTFGCLKADWLSFGTDCSSAVLFCFLHLFIIRFLTTVYSSSQHRDWKVGLLSIPLPWGLVLATRGHQDTPAHPGDIKNYSGMCPEKGI